MHTLARVQEYLVPIVRKAKDRLSASLAMVGQKYPCRRHFLTRFLHHPHHHHNHTPNHHLYYLPTPHHHNPDESNRWLIDQNAPSFAFPSNLLKTLNLPNLLHHPNPLSQATPLIIFTSEVGMQGLRQLYARKRKKTSTP
ncbi:hypothetical protein ACLOJK_034386 [Asimina triloba]